jgi:DNA polymerase I-like protein with 3'-5' exonuclease and polymerase domains|tara:strand:- start:1016 stop:2866 length:1851 start_codon:yes stop_codon:yes gene_type:complete
MKTLFTPDTNWNQPDFKDLTGEPIVAVDLETRDPNLREMGSGAVRGEGEVVGIAVAVPGYKAYFPIAHEAGGNLDANLVWKWFKKNVADTQATKVFHNAMYDVSWIKANGIELKGKVEDTMLIAGLLDENRFSYSLNSVAKEYIGQTKKEAILKAEADAWGVDAKAEMWKLPADSVGNYAEADADITFELHKRFKFLIEEEDIQDVVTLESDLFPCLVDMKFKGVRFNQEKAEKLRVDFALAEEKALGEIKKESGMHIDIWAASSIQKVFESLGINYDTTDKGAPSFTKNFLTTHSNPIVRKIAEAREYNKARSTFIDSLTKHVRKGRIHADINQLRSDAGGTVTGRFSYANPNLQQIPAHHKIIGPALRALFLPEEGCQWGCFDYSQQEPRLLVHYAVASGIPGSEVLQNRYDEPKADFHQMVANIANIERKQAKTINLGIMYGMGKNKLMGEIGATKAEAERILGEYHRLFPVVNQLKRKVENKVSKHGFLRTKGGRRLHFPYWEPHGFNVAKPIKGKEKAEEEYGQGMVKRSFVYRALNKLIQGSAADQTKQAMIALYREGVIPHVQIHDELDISVASDEDAKRIISIMEEAVQLEVPNKVDYEKGENWGSIS